MLIPGVHAEFDLVLRQCGEIPGTSFPWNIRHGRIFAPDLPLLRFSSELVPLLRHTGYGFALGRRVREVVPTAREMQ